MRSLEKLPESYSAILIDAMNVLTRFFYSPARLTDERGFPTSMLYGAIKLVLRMKAAYPTAKVVFLFEGFQSKRKAMYADYKKNRTAKPTDFQACVQEVRDVLPLLGVWQAYSTANLEADDVAGYLSKRSKGRVLCISRDRDWWAYVNDRVDVQLPDGVIYTESDLTKQLGYPPYKVPLWKVLKGDSSDGLSGVPRFPTALALQLVRECDSIDQFVKCKIPKKWRDVLIDEWDTVERNWALTAYHEEWVRKEDVAITPPDKRSQAKPLLKKVLLHRNMTSLVKALV